MLLNQSLTFRTFRRDMALFVALGLPHTSRKTGKLAKSDTNLNSFNSLDFPQAKRKVSEFRASPNVN